MALEIPVREISTMVKNNLRAPDAFDPAEHSRSFVIYSTEYFECVYLPILVAHFAKYAPPVTVNIGILSQEFPEKEMTNGEVNIQGLEAL